MRARPGFDRFGVCVLVILAVTLIAASAAAQTAGGSARTPWGDPDLQGVWNFSSNTLVVTTTNFRDTVFDPDRVGGGHRPGGAGLVIEERFTRAADDTLTYEFTMNDPAWYTAPCTAQLQMAWSDQPLYEFACHEGNYGLYNILAGALGAEEVPAGSR